MTNLTRLQRATRRASRIAAGVAVPLFLTVANGCAPHATPVTTPPRAQPTAAAKGAPKALDTLAQWVDHYGEGITSGAPEQAFHGELFVAKHDDVIVHRAYRTAEGRRYRIGSVTKVFTAVAVHQLVEAGTLSLDDSARKHLPELPAAYDAVTLGQLLCHRGGLANYTTDKDLMAVRDQPKTSEEMLAVITSQPLTSKPGERWNYSNSGYFLLGLVIERTTHKTWSSFLAKHIFEPAKMTQTGPTDDALAPPLTVTAGKLAPAHAVHLSIPFSAGSLSSTAADLHLFARALQDDTLLTSAARKRMWEDRGGPSKDVGWSYGWMLRTRDGHKTVGHTGGIDGFSSAFEISADGTWTVVALSNNDAGVAAGKAAGASFKMAVTNRAIAPPKPPKFVPFDGKLAKAVIGEFHLPTELEAKVRKMLGDKLTDSIVSMTITADGDYRFKPVGQGQIVLRLVDQGTLINAVRGITLTPELSKDGTVAAVMLKQGGLVLRYER
jgi:CubicO group peptidase (beta-lactamase class C family)